MGGWRKNRRTGIQTGAGGEEAGTPRWPGGSFQRLAVAASALVKSLAPLLRLGEGERQDELERYGDALGSRVKSSDSQPIFGA